MAVAAMLMVGLAGCGSISDRTAAAAFTSPGKYNIYTCQDVERSIAGCARRQVELEQLMARASQGAGGEFVNTIAYRGEYAQGRGDLIELAKAKADKQCAAESKYLERARGILISQTACAPARRRGRARRAWLRRCRAASAPCRNWCRQ